MQSNLELAIANLEMLATAIQSKAENVARLASCTSDPAHSVQLWGLAEGLNDYSLAARRQASLIMLGA